jgi:hypothetical protein
MVKLLTGLIAAVVVALGGYFGVELYLQQRAERDVEAAFAQIRASGGKASHGKVTFDMWSRRITVADMVAESAAEPQLGVKIASLTASGVNQPDPSRFSADRIEVTGIEGSATAGTDTGKRVTYKVPSLVATGIAAPVRPLRTLDAASPTDIYRYVLEHVAAVTATSITAPTLSATLTVAGAAAVEYSYTDLALRDVKDGKIAATTAARASFTADIPQNGRREKISGEFANMAAYDFDARATLALLDPAPTSDDTVLRAYRQLSFGAYTAAMPNGVQMRIDGVTVDDIGLRPSKLRLADLQAFMAATLAAGTPPTTAQARLLVDKLAGFYEAIRIGNAEIRGLAFDTPQGPFKLAAFRFNLDNGKFGEIALEGVDMRSPKGPVQIGRFALKSVDVSNLLRVTSRFAAPGQTPPSTDQLLTLLPLLGGVEIRDTVAPYKNKADPVRAEQLSLDWGQFVGSIPSKARLTAKFSSPIDLTDAGFELLVAAGITTMAVNFDLAANWNEEARSFVLEPAMAELAGVSAMSARIAFANVPRTVFSTNPIQAAIMATQIEAGPIEITFRDLGGIDLAVGQYARMQMVGNDVARRAVLDNIAVLGAAMATANPDATDVADALVRFVENPRGTLTIKLTPLGKVPAMQMIGALKNDPAAALARFRIEASTGR